MRSKRPKTAPVVAPHRTRGPITEGDVLALDPKQEPRTPSTGFGKLGKLIVGGALALVALKVLR